MSKCKRWCYTSFNHLDSESQLSNSDYLQYHIWQEETCPNTGKRHLQGYIEFTKSVGLSYIKNHWRDATTHFERARGTAEENIAYCSKSSSGGSGNPTIVGTPFQSHQGKRNDLYALKKSIDEGATDAELYENHFPVMFRHKRHVDEYRKHLSESAQVLIPVVILIYSKHSGTGKSHLAESMYGPEFTYFTSVPGYFDGYSDHRCICFDDFHGHNYSFSSMKRYLDKYKVNLPVKFSSIPRNSETIIITSNYLPCEWYTNEKITINIDTLTRRIHLYIFKPSIDETLYFINYDSFAHYVLENENKRNVFYLLQ